MTTIRCFQACTFLTTFIFSLSGFKIFDGEGESLILARPRRSAPEFIRADSIMRSLRSEPIYEQGILRKLKRSAYGDFEDRNVHTDGLLRSVRSVDNRSLVSIPRDENDQDDEQTIYFTDEKRANFNRGLINAVPEKSSIRSSLVPYRPYDGLGLWSRYL